MYQVIAKECYKAQGNAKIKYIADKIPDTTEAAIQRCS